MADEVEVAEAAQPSIAQLMAKQGYHSEDRPVEKPVENKQDNEQKVETKVEVPAATASAETKVETVVQETKKPEGVEAKVVEEKPSSTISWQEVLKQQQPDTVLKELLGVDDKKIGLVHTLKDLPPQMVGFIEAWKSNGDLSAYLKEMTTDYSKMSSEDVMRNQIRLDYPKVTSERAIEALFRKKVIEEYQLDPDKYSKEEVEEGQLLLDAEADKYRDVLTERQKQFLIPKAPEAAEPEPDNSEQEMVAKIEQRKAYVNNDPFVKNMYATKQFTIGEGAEAFNFPIDTISIAGVLDGEKWPEAINEVSVNEQGQRILKPKPEHQALVSLVAHYGKTFLDAYAQHFKTIGAKVIDKLDNAKPPVEVQTAASEITNTNPAAAMAKTGRLTN